MPDAMPSVWQRQQQMRKDLLLWRAWRQAGFPDTLSDDLAVDVSTRCSAATRAWILDTPYTDICDDQLMHRWLALLDSLSDADPDDARRHA